MFVEPRKSLVACLITAAVYTSVGLAPAEAALTVARNQRVAGAAADPASPAPVADPSAATSGARRETDEGSRGVARRLLLAGFAAAAVIAILSGAFALRQKKQPGLGSNP
jgi:hypothetical protein